MKKAAEAVWLVVRNILFIGFTLQICMGLIWMAGNLMKIQDFTPADTGVYPFFARLAGRGCVLLYPLQTGFALYAGYRLLGKLCVGEKRICLWGSLALMTLPMAMQCHLALLPYSFTGSLELLELSFLCESERGGLWEKALWRILGCYGVQCLLWPGYAIPGAVLPLLLLIRRLPGMVPGREGLRRGLLLAACFLAVTAAGLGMNRRESGGKEGIPEPVWTLAKRVCWPTLWADWSRVLGEYGLSEDVLWRSSYYPCSMEEFLRPALEENMTPEAGEELVKKMTGYAWNTHYPMVIKQIGWDVLGYGVTPLILPLQLAGDAYDSCSGRNYEIMRNGMPAVTKYYVRVSCGWFAVSLILTLAGAAAFCIAEPAAMRSIPARAVPVLTVLFSAGMVILFFTMQGAGIMDYKYTFWINQLWILASIKIMTGLKKREKGHES